MFGPCRTGHGWFSRALRASRGRSGCMRAGATARRFAQRPKTKRLHLRGNSMRNSMQHLWCLPRRRQKRPMRGRWCSHCCSFARSRPSLRLHFECQPASGVHSQCGHCRRAGANSLTTASMRSRQWRWIVRSSTALPPNALANHARAKEHCSRPKARLQGRRWIREHSRQVSQCEQTVKRVLGVEHVIRPVPVKPTVSSPQRV